MPNNYLEKHLEPYRGEEHSEQSKAYERLGSPLAQVEYSKDAGTVEIKTPDLEVAFTYEPKGEYDEHRKVLKCLTLTNPHSEGKLSLEDILPPDYRVIFIPRAEEIGETGPSLHDGLTKTIEVPFDLAKAQGILKLLHEIGHAASEKKLSDEDKIKMGEPHTAIHSRGKVKMNPEQLERVLLDERDAWAFALAKIKPFLNDSNLRKEDVLEYIHGEMALGSYSDDIRERLAELIDTYEEHSKIVARN